MIEKAKLDLFVGGSLQTIRFGIAESIEEREEVYRLRYKIYSERRYILPESFSSGIETDTFDQKVNTTYFIAKLDNRLLGSVRLIRAPLLPIRDFFEFANPSFLDSISPNRQCEISRLVIDKYSDTEYLPRNVVLLILIHVLLEYCKEEDIEVAFAFIKEKLQAKLRRLGIPLHTIESFTCVYPKSGPMWNYFNDESDKVHPSYFRSDALENFIDDTLEKRSIFEKVGADHFILRDTLYTEFLMLLKII